MSEQNRHQQAPESQSEQEKLPTLDEILNQKPKEIGGPKGPEPTRYGDWERKGRCIDF